MKSANHFISQRSQSGHFKQQLFLVSSVQKHPGEKFYSTLTYLGDRQAVAEEASSHY